MTQEVNPPPELAAQWVKRHTVYFANGPMVQCSLSDMNMLLNSLHTEWGAQQAIAKAPNGGADDLDAAIEWLETQELTVNVGNVSGAGDELLESSVGAALRLLRGMRAALQRHADALVRCPTCRDTKSVDGSFRHDGELQTKQMTCPDCRVDKMLDSSQGPTT
jgi:Zn finger protein HypA/HybF involved in hydrogenase expression